jgi:high-affinity nickel-transport protein
MEYGGVFHALLLASCFMLGMMATDAVNGLWISHLLQRADASARAASRIMGVTIALLSLAVAGLGLSRHLFPEVSAWQDGRELFVGIAIILVVAASFLFARYTRQRVSAVV